MKNIWTLAKRESQTFFDSLTGYMLIIIFLLISGFFTWFYGFLGPDIFMGGQADLRPFFTHSLIALLLFVPAITMRMIAEEKKTGTLEALLTRPVSDGQVVMGKFLACLILIGIALVCTLPYYWIVSLLGPVDHGAVWCGYLGLILLSAAYIGIGLYASSLTSNQVVAFLITLFVGLVFILVFGMVSSYSSGWISSLFASMSMFAHFQSLARGVLDIRDVVYFLSIAVLGLLMAEAQLLKRNVIR